MLEAIRHQEIQLALRWYLKTKNHAIKNAITLRCPLSIENQRDIRHYYSHYFVGLISATEMLLEKEYPYRKAFRQELVAALRFKEFQDGAANYSYLRELRNSIIHRGLDVCAVAHFKDNIPLFIAPESVKSRAGIEFHRFGTYLLEIIAKCDSTLNQVFANHLRSVGLLEPAMTPFQTRAHLLGAISETMYLPDWAKDMAMQGLSSMDFAEHHMAAAEGLMSVLSECVLTPPQSPSN